MSNQYLKLRRSAVPGKVPDTASLDFGEIALNTYDGLAFMKISSSIGQEVIAIGGGAGDISGSTYYAAIFSGSNAVITGSIYDSGSFTGIGAIASIHAGAPERLFVDASDTDSYNLISGHGTINNYLQLNIKNFSSGNTGSSDVVATADNGDEFSQFIDMGINSSGYNIQDGIGGPNDAYLYSIAQDLLIGNAASGKRVIIFNGDGPALDNARLYITSQGTVGINSSDANLYNPEALLVEPLVSGAAAPNDFNNLILGRGTVNESYMQLNMINKGSGSAASTDIVATNNTGNETSNYIDMGINSSGFNMPNAVGIANDAYLYSTGRHLHIGNASNYPIQFFVGGLDSDTNRKLQLNVNDQHEVTGSLTATQGFTGSLFGTASWAQNSLTSSITINALTASSADNFVVRNSLTASSALINGTLTAQTLVVQTITSSIVYSSGSNNFGSQLTDRQTFTGSVSITGSLSVNGNNVITSDVTASMSVASASFAQTASYVINAISSSYVSGSAATITNLTSSNDASINGLTIGKGANNIISNTAIGASVLRVNTSGVLNTVIGYFSGYKNSVGNANTAIGYGSLYENLSGSENTTIGRDSLANIRSGSQNVTLGGYASTYINATLNSTQVAFISASVMIGYLSSPLSNGSINEIAIGYKAVGSGSNTVVIGNNDITNTHLKGSITTTGAFTGSLFGTSSWAQNSITASYALNVSGTIANAVSSSYAYTASSAVSSSYALTASYFSGYVSPFPYSGSAQITGSLDVTGSIIATTGFTGSLFGTASWALNFSGSVTSASYSSTASLAVSSSYASTASFLLGSVVSSSYAYTASSAVSSSYSYTASSAVSSSLAQTASYVLNAISSSYAFTASSAVSASYILNAISSSYAFTASSAISASQAQTASYIVNAISSSYTFTASLAVSSSFSTTSLTASYANSGFDIGIAEFQTTSSITVAGTTIVSSINTGSFTSAFYNYTIASGSNARSGQVMSVWQGTTIRYTEVTTTDIGNTATASFAATLSGPTVRLSFTAPGVWTVKSIANLL